MRGKIFALCLAAVCLTSCAKGAAPLHKNEHNENVSLNADYEYADVKDISDTRLSEEYGHLEFDFTPNLTLPDELYNFTLVQADDYYEYQSNICKLFLDDENAALSTSNANTENELRQCELSNGGVLNLNRNGEVGFIRNNAAYEYRDESTYKKVVFLDTEYDDITIHQKNGDILLSELTRSVQEYMDKYSGITNASPQIPKRAYIASSGKYDVVLFSFTQSIDGLGLATFNTRCVGNVSKAAEEWGTTIVIGTDGDVIFFSDLDGERRLKEKGAEISRLITPQSAVRNLDEYLAANSEYTVCSFSLELLPLIESNPRQDDEGFEWTVSATNYGTVYSVEPYWSFVLRDNVSGDLFNAAINAVSGEIFFGKEI